MSIRLGIVDDHDLLVVGLTNCLASMDEVDEVSHAGTVPALLAVGPAPQLVLLDLRLADDSVPADNVALLHHAGCQVIAYTSGEDVRLVRSALASGVLGIVSKREPVDTLREAVRQGLRGEVVASSDWASAIDSDPAAPVNLTPREREVLALYASGEKAVTVAHRLNISRETVLDHIRHIRTKYSQAARPAETKVDLYRRALEDGIFDGPD